jgi:hypothetical protein
MHKQKAYRKLRIEERGGELTIAHKTGPQGEGRSEKETISIWTLSLIR